MTSEKTFFRKSKPERLKRGYAYDKFDIDKSETDKTPYEILWYNVLLQQFKDAEKLYSPKAEYRNSAKRAINWLWNNKNDFEEVCILAGYEPTYTKLYVRRWLKRIYPSLLRGGWFVPPDIGTLKRRKKGD